jgi:hypothetical protein
MVTIVEERAVTDHNRHDRRKPGNVVDAQTGFCVEEAGVDELGRRRRMRILVANEPRSYREAIAHAIQALKPGAEVIVVEPAALDFEMKRLTPQLVICSRVTPAVEAGVPAWIELYPEYESLARLSLGGKRLTVAGIELEDLLSAVERAEDLVKTG